MTHFLSRRSFTFGAAGLGLAGLAAPPAWAGAAELDHLYRAAQAEGSVVWYIAQIDTETAEQMGRAFTERYPGVKVSVIRTTGQVAYERLLQDIKNNAPQCDVFSSTDISQYPALKARGALAVYRPDGADTLLPPFAALSDPGFWYPITATSHLLICNSEKVAPDDRPKRWTDLLDPKWKGRVAVGHPAFSGCTGIWALALRKTYGWEYFEKLAKNNPRIGRSGNDPVSLIIASECLVGPAPASTAFQQLDKGNPILPIYPEDGATLCVGPSAVMAKAPHPNAARLFTEWLMSDDFARLAVTKHTDPVHPGATLTSGQLPMDEVPLMKLTVQEIGKGVPEVIEAWRDTFGG